MNRRYVVPILAVLTALTLSGCDSKRAVRQSMDDCKLNAKSSGASDYLQICMQNRDFSLDAELKECPAQPFPAYDENCYRPNGRLMRFSTSLRLRDSCHSQSLNARRVVQRETKASHPPELGCFASLLDGSVRNAIPNTRSDRTHGITFRTIAYRRG
jgi:hypothetical protein